MNAIELRKKSVDELKTELIALLKEQFNLRIQKAGQQTGSPTHMFKEIRRTVARIKTILREKEGSSI